MSSAFENLLQYTKIYKSCGYRNFIHNFIEYDFQKQGRNRHELVSKCHVQS